MITVIAWVVAGRGSERVSVAYSSVLRSDSMSCQTAVDGFASGGSPRRFAQVTARKTPVWKSPKFSFRLSQEGMNFLR